jgi:hypothetical protein
MTEHHESEHHEYGEEERVPEHSGTNHSMAIGFYISAIILIFGVTLVLTGILTPGQQTQGDLGFNVNLWWGVVMVVSGCAILGMTLASPRRRAAREAQNRSERTYASGSAKPPPTQRALSRAASPCRRYPGERHDRDTPGTLQSRRIAWCRRSHSTTNTHDPALYRKQRAMR